MDFLDAQGILRDAAVEISLDPDLPLVRGDRHLLEQVIVNLVVNACQASPGGRVAVGTLAKVLGSRTPQHRAAGRRRGNQLPDPGAGLGTRASAA